MRMISASGGSRTFSNPVTVAAMIRVNGIAAVRRAGTVPADVLAAVWRDMAQDYRRRQLRLDRSERGRRWAAATLVNRLRRDAMALRLAQARAATTTRLARLMRTAMRIFGITCEELTGPGRMRVAVLARSFVAFWARRLTRLSFVQIAEKLGGRDHTTILHSEQRWPEFRAEARAVIAESRTRAAKLARSKPTNQ